MEWSSRQDGKNHTAVNYAAYISIQEASATLFFHQQYRLVTVVPIFIFGDTECPTITDCVNKIFTVVLAENHLLLALLLLSQF